MMHMQFLLFVVAVVACARATKVTLKARASSSSLDADVCNGAVLGHASRVTTCSNDGICQDVRLSAASPLPEDYVSTFTLEAKDAGTYVIMATVDGAKQCIKPQMCGSKPSMYECSSGFFSFGSKDAWRIIDAEKTSGGTKLYKIVNDACAGTTLTIWLPNTPNATGCELAFPNDPAGGACQTNPTTGDCDKITGSPLFDLWEIHGFSDISQATRNGAVMLSLCTVLLVGALV